MHCTNDINMLTLQVEEFFFLEIHSILIIIIIIIVIIMHELV